MADGDQAPLFLRCLIALICLWGSQGVLDRSGPSSTPITGQRWMLSVYHLLGTLFTAVLSAAELCIRRLGVIKHRETAHISAFKSPSTVHRLLLRLPAAEHIPWPGFSDSQSSSLAPPLYLTDSGRQAPRWRCFDDCQPSSMSQEGCC